MKKINLIDANDFILTATLDGKQYILHFAWNDTAGFWSMGIRDSKNNNIVERIRLVLSYPLTNQYRRHGLPPGEFLCVPANDSVTEIDRTSFITGAVTLLYVTGDEYAAI